MPSNSKSWAVVLVRQHCAVPDPSRHGWRYTMFTDDDDAARREAKALADSAGNFVSAIMWHSRLSGWHDSVIYYRKGELFDVRGSVVLRDELPEATYWEMIEALAAAVNLVTLGTHVDLSEVEPTKAHQHPEEREES